MYRWYLLLALSGCVQTGTVQCADGTICPAGTRCDETHGLCVSEQQLVACRDRTDGEACELPQGTAGTCNAGVCLGAVCGDGIAQASEDCDGDDLRGPDNATCSAHGYYAGGPVSCAADCTFELSLCEGICGNDVIEGDESCDGPQLGVVTDCMQLGFYEPGPVTCNALCRYDDAQCAGACGDGILDPVELCDGAPPQQSCLGFGYDGGFLDCIPQGCAPAFAGCRLIDFEQIQLGVTGGIRSISAAPGIVLAAASTSGILRYDGTSWNPQAIPSGAGLVFSVHVASSQLAFAAAEEALLVFDGTSWSVDPRVVDPNGLGPGRLAGTGLNDVYLWLRTRALRFDGQSWTELAGAPAPVASAFAVSPSEYWIVTGLGTVWRGAGTAWTEVTTPLAIAQSVVLDSGGALVVGGRDANGDPLVARRVGTTWTTYDLTPEIVGTPGGQVVVAEGNGETRAFVTSSSTLVRFDGASWRRSHLFRTTNLLAVEWDGTSWLTGGTSGYLGRETPNAFVPVDDQLPAMFGPSGIWGRACDDIFFSSASVFLGDPTRILHYDGERWQVELDIPDDNVVLDVFGAPDGTMYATTFNGEVLRRTGTTWTVIQTFTRPLRTGWAGVGGVVVVAGDEGWLHWLSGGTWSSLQLTNLGISDVWGVSPTEIYIASHSTTPLLRFDGTQVTPEPVPTTRALTAVWGDASGTLVAVGATGQRLHRENGAWRTAPPIAIGDLVHLHGTSANDLFAVDSTGGIAHFDGMHWALVRYDGMGAWNRVWTGGACTYFGGGYSPAQLVRLDRGEPW